MITRSLFFSKGSGAERENASEATALVLAGALRLDGSARGSAVRVA
jgi:hypothetical protein